MKNVLFAMALCGCAETTVLSHDALKEVCERLDTELADQVVGGEVEAEDVAATRACLRLSCTHIAREIRENYETENSDGEE